MKWHPYSLFFKFLLLHQRGEGAWELVPLSYSSDSGAARICHGGGGGGGERERNDLAGGGGGVPSHGREIF